MSPAPHPRSGPTIPGPRPEVLVPERMGSAPLAILVAGVVAALVAAALSGIGTRDTATLVGLTAKELDLLTHFMANQGRAFTRNELLHEVWGYDIGDTATVTVHVQRLREKIESEPRSPRHLVTVRGVGYRFDP